MVSSNPGRGTEGEAGMQNDSDDSGQAGGAVQMDPRVQTEIGKHLRAIYDDVINEPVPDRFMELLEKLERSTQKAEKPTG